MRYNDNNNGNSQNHFNIKDNRGNQSSQNNLKYFELSIIDCALLLIY